jgi:hypothetical protein
VGVNAPYAIELAESTKFFTYSQSNPVQLDKR